MQLSQSDVKAFKQWLLPKLETISDAESSILADYIIELVSSEGSEASIKDTCLVNLADFLRDHTESIVNDVVHAIKKKSYISSPSSRSENKNAQPVPTPSANTVQAAPAPIPSIVGPNYLPSFGSTDGPPPNAPTGPSAMRHLPSWPPVPPTTRQLNTAGLQTGRKEGGLKRKVDDDTHGRNLPHQGGRHNRPIKQTKWKDGRNTRPGPAVQQQNGTMPTFGAMPVQPSPFPNMSAFNPQDPFSLFMAMAASFGLQLPPMNQMPSAGQNAPLPPVQAWCRDYHTKGFCAIGNMCPYQHGVEATIPLSPEAYDPNNSSLGMRRGGPRGGRNRAPISRNGPSDNVDSSANEHELDDEGINAIDLEAIRKRQEVAQQVFEEKQKRSEEVAAKAQDIERQLRATQNLMLNLRKELATKTSEEFDEDAFLNDQLFMLQAQAQDLFAAHETDISGIRDNSSLGRGFTSRRGQGPGYWSAVFNGNSRSSVKRLDNRPKRLAISNIEAGSSKHEAIRRFILNYHDCESLTWHTEQVNTLVVAFKERYLAEIFLDDISNIQDVGELELSWVPNGISVIEDRHTHVNEEERPLNGVEPRGEIKSDLVEGPEADYDVADDVDQWL